MLFASWTDIATTAPWSFLIGVAIGFLLSDRFRIVRRNGRRDYDSERGEH